MSKSFFFFFAVEKTSQFYLSFYANSAYLSFGSVKLSGEFLVISATGSTFVGQPGGNRTAMFEGTNTLGYTPHVVFRANNSCYLAFDVDGNAINPCATNASDTKTWFNIVPTL